MNLEPIENDYVLYPQAVAIKELGFNEPCLFSFYHYGEKIDSIYADLCNYNAGKRVSAPTYSQAFRFFRNNYKLHSHINSDNSWNISGGIWDLNGYKDSRYDLDSDAYKSYPEAELTCLIKLIEIVKRNKKP